MNDEDILNTYRQNSLSELEQILEKTTFGSVVYWAIQKVIYEKMQHRQ